MLNPFEVIILIAVITLVVMLLRNQRFHELANGLARNYCEKNSLQFLDGTVSFRGLMLDRKRFHLCRSYRFDYSLNSVDRHQGLITLCGEHIQSFRVNPDHLDAITIQ